jgi:predicted deacetylase
MKKMIKKIVGVGLAIIVFLLFTLFLVRAFSHIEIDDVSPMIDCEENLIEKSSILWVIPKFEGIPISEDKEWCSYILSLNKTIGLHGVYHTFEEFNQEHEGEYLQEGIKIFEECFGYSPTMFKPPQLKISPENSKLIKENNLILKLETNQITHKVYHCGDYGKKRNWIIDLF